MHFRCPRALSLTTGLALLFLGCAPFRPAVPISLQPSPPHDGVTLSVARVSCNENVDPDWLGQNLVDAIVEARIDNRSSGIVTVRGDAFRLVATDGQAILTSSWNATNPVQVAAGTSKLLQLSFSTRGGLSCSGPMRLEPGNAASQGSRKVHLPAVSFRPAPG